MKKSTTIRMSMYCPDVPPTPFGMMDRNVTRRRPPKSSKKAAEPSKLSLRRADQPSDPPSDQENAPPAAATPRRQGRRLFSRPEIAEIAPAAEMPPPPPPPPALATARRPLRPTAAPRVNSRRDDTQGGSIERAERHTEKQSADRELQSCVGAGEDTGLETEKVLQRMTEMTLTEGRTSGEDSVPSGDGERPVTEVQSGREMETGCGEAGSPGSRKGTPCEMADSPQNSPPPARLGPLAEAPSPVGSGTSSSADHSPAAEGLAPRPPLSSDSFVSAASSPVVGRPLSPRTPARTPVPAPPPAPAEHPASDSDSERSLPYFTPRRPARRRPAAAVVESSDDGSDVGGGAAPLLARALRRLPASTSTPAPGGTAGWRLDATGMPSPVLEDQAVTVGTQDSGCGTNGQDVQGAGRKTGEEVPHVIRGTEERAVRLQVPEGRPQLDNPSDPEVVESPVKVAEDERGPAATSRTLSEEMESSSPSVELVAAPSKLVPSTRRKPSPPPAPPVLAARAPIRPPDRFVPTGARPVASPVAKPVASPASRPPLTGARPVASPVPQPPRLPAGAAAAVDVARWLEESPLLTALSEESDVVVIDSDQEWDDSDLLSVSERAAAAGVGPDDGLPPPPPPVEPQQRGRPRPELAQPAAPQTPPPRQTRPRSAGSSSSSEDELEKFKRQFVTPRQQRRVSSSSSEDFIDDGPLSSESEDGSYRRAVAADFIRRTPRVAPQICASDESLEAAEPSPEEPPFRPPPQRQVKRAPRPSPSPSASRPLSFMSSLAAHVMEGCRRHPEAAGFVSSFRSRRLQLARRLFDMVNTEVFQNQLPPDLEIKFNKRMLRTAGYCYSRQSAAPPSAAAARSARVELSEKVVDSAERLRDTLIHELCHAAAWVVSGYRGGHGPVWRGWAARVQRRFPELPPVTRCHSYQIHCKYTYRCTGCGYSFGRHSKSLDVTRKVCGRCRGVFECLLTAKVGEEGGAPTPATPRAAAPFALFVKEHYSAVKSASAGMKHAEVMRLLGKKFAEAKISQSKAKATGCDDL